MTRPRQDHDKTKARPRQDQGKTKTRPRQDQDKTKIKTSHKAKLQKNRLSSNIRVIDAKHQIKMLYSRQHHEYVKEKSQGSDRSR
jgi:hypothetical protein